MATAETDLLVRARSALLDALVALDEHADSVVVIGAQAIHLRTGDISLALAPATKDADLTLDPRSLGDTPLVDRALIDAGFVLDPIQNQPGAWINAAGMPVDIMVPEALAGPGGRRSGRVRRTPTGRCDAPTAWRGASATTHRWRSVRSTAPTNGS